MITFSQQLFRSVVPGILIVLLVTGLLLDALIVNWLEEDFDQLLTAKSQGIVALAEFEGDAIMVEQYEHALPQFAATENGEYFQFFEDSGQLVLSSRSIPGGIELSSLDTHFTNGFSDILLPDSRPGRLLRTRFLPRVDIDEIRGEYASLEMGTVMLDFDIEAVPDNVGTITVGSEIVRREPMTLYLAISRKRLDKLCSQVHLLIGSSALFTMILITWLAGRRIRSSVQPLRSMANQVEALDTLQLHQRIKLEQPVVELGVVAEKINTLLGKLEIAFNKERHFSADVAHELRTPLTELRSLIEVRQRWPDEAALSDEFLADAAQATLRMQRTVESLLTLSRAESNITEGFIITTLPELLQKAVEANRGRATASNISLLVSVTDDPVRVRGLDEWPIIVNNLLDNAIEYSEPGSTVFAALRLEDLKTTVTLSVSNKTHNITQADIQFLFERLWRKDKSRSSSCHAGLGLALVEACAFRIGATVDCDLSDKELTITIHCPAETVQEQPGSALLTT